MYEELNESLGNISTTAKEKPGAAIAEEEAEKKGLVSRKRAVPEGSVSSGHTDSQQPPRVFPWPERYVESLPILEDPYCRRAYHSRQTASWESVTQGELDQLNQYGMNPFPISRPPEDIIRKIQDGHCQSSLQLSIIVANLGNLARPMKFGGKEVHVCNSEKKLKNACSIPAQIC